MIRKDILEYNKKLGCTVRVKLNPEMQRDINLVIGKIMGDVSMKDKIKQILEMDDNELLVSKPHNRNLEFVN